jgi:transposase
VKKARKDKEYSTQPEAVLDESERLELIRLRAELKDTKAANTEVQMQVEFAKKVATWFAKGKQ